MEQNKELKLIKDDGTEISCEIIFTYYSEEYKKNYVVFSVPEEEMLSAASYEIKEDGTNGELVFIEDEKEWEMLEEVVGDYYENSEDEEECECGCNHHENCDCEEECQCNHDEHECQCENDEHECKCENDEHECCGHKN